MRVPTGATLAYPPGWRAARGDTGTATAELTDTHGRFLGYLNLTPRQGRESQANWTAFRAHHNAGEGDTHVTVLVAAHDLRFRRGRGSCVRDSYRTITGAQFIEIACLVATDHRSSVIVGAAPPARWAHEAPVIERAISAMTP